MHHSTHTLHTHTSNFFGAFLNFSGSQVVLVTLVVIVVVGSGCWCHLCCHKWTQKENSRCARFFFVSVLYSLLLLLVFLLLQTYVQHWIDYKIYKFFSVCSFFKLFFFVCLWMPRFTRRRDNENACIKFKFLIRKRTMTATAKCH